MRESAGLSGSSNQKRTVPTDTRRWLFGRQIGTHQMRVRQRMPRQDEQGQEDRQGRTRRAVSWAP